MKIDWFFAICNVLFFYFGYFIQEIKVAKMEKLNELYKKMAEAKVVETIKLYANEEKMNDQ